MQLRDVFNSISIFKLSELTKLRDVFLSVLRCKVSELRCVFTKHFVKYVTWSESGLQTTTFSGLRSRWIILWNCKVV
jgi:hypothetical protein